MYTDHGDRFVSHYFFGRHDGQVRDVHQQIAHRHQRYADIYGFRNVPETRIYVYYNT